MGCRLIVKINKCWFEAHIRPRVRLFTAEVMVGFGSEIKIGKRREKCRK